MILKLPAKVFRWHRKQKKLAEVYSFYNTNKLRQNLPGDKNTKNVKKDFINVNRQNKTFNINL